MHRTVIALSMLLTASWLGAHGIVFDPHVDLPKSAANPAWSGLSDYAPNQIDKRWGANVLRV